MIKIYKKIELFFIILIFFIALIIRFSKLSEIPHGFFCDEAALGFNAYKILTTGKDENGITLPFYILSFGDYRNPVSIYAMIPAITILGLNEFSVRATPAFLGSITVIFLFLFLKEVFWKSPPIIQTITSLGSALFLAISPWHIQFSRVGFEVTFQPFFLILSLFLLFRFLRINESQKKKNTRACAKRSLILSAVLLAITFYTYLPIQLVLIPFIGIILLIYKKNFFFKIIRNWTFLFLLIFFASFIPLVFGIVKGQALTHFVSVSPLANHANIKNFAKPMIKTYFSHFSFDFLFGKGDIDMPGHFITRHSVRGIGELYLFQLPLLLVGLFSLIFRHRRIFFFILIWLGLYPIGSTVVGEGPFAHRSIFGVIPFQILSGFGLAVISEQIGRLKLRPPKLKIFLKMAYWGTVSVIILVSLNGYLFKYFKEYPNYSSDFWGWQYGPKDIMKYFLNVRNHYDDLYMSGEFNGAEIFLKFYDLDNRCQNKCKIGDFWRQPFIYNPNRRQLFSLSPEYLNNSTFKSDFLIKHTLYYPDGKVAFLIGEIIL
jgi:hypothetical protein